MVIKAIIFDCFGVLINQDGILKIVNAFPQHVSDFKKLFHSSDGGRISRRHFLEAFTKITSVSEKELAEKYLDFDDRNLYNQEAIDWVIQIKKSGKYKVGMLSNVGHGWLDSFLKDMAKNNLFDSYVLSCDEGIAKPDPEIYKIMAEKIGCNTDECIMIDDRDINVTGAKAVGMQGIVFVSTTQARAELKSILESANA